MMEHVWDPRTSVFDTFENDLRKFADFRALMVIFNVRSWKRRKKKLPK